MGESSFGANLSFQQDTFNDISIPLRNLFKNREFVENEGFKLGWSSAIKFEIPSILNTLFINNIGNDRNLTDIIFQNTIKFSAVAIECNNQPVNIIYPDNLKSVLLFNVNHDYISQLNPEGIEAILAIFDIYNTNIDLSIITNLKTIFQLSSITEEVIISRTQNIQEVIIGDVTSNPIISWTDSGMISFVTELIENPINNGEFTYYIYGGNSALSSTLVDLLDDLEDKGWIVNILDTTP